MNDEDLKINFDNITREANTITTAMENFTKTLMECCETNYHCPYCNTKLIIYLIYDDYVDLYCQKCEKLIKAKI